MIKHDVNPIGPGVAARSYSRNPSVRSTLIAAAVALLPNLAALGGTLPFAFDPSVDTSKFRVTTFATGLNYPTSMQRLSDGSLLVATSNPTNGSMFGSTGELVRLVDANKDGVADGPGTVLATGLAGAMTSVRTAGNYVLATSVATGQERITVLKSGPTPSSPLTVAGTVNFEFPAGYEHVSYALGVRPAPGLSGAHEVYFNVGAQENSATTPNATTVGVSGLINGTLRGDSIYRMTLADQAGTPVLSGLTQIATGLRNAAGMAFQAGTGDLFFQDNGIDGLVNRNEPLSADELNKITAGQIGGAIEDFGFATNYTEYRTGSVIGGGGVQPIAAFQPIPDGQTGAESEGAVEIAFSPDLFPAEFRNGIFLGFHGKYNLGGLSNEENPLVYYDLATGEYIHFILGQQDGIGHLDGLLATTDSLFVADLASSGNVGTRDVSGVIYQIQAIAVPEPGSLISLCLGFAGCLAARMLQRRRGICRV
jgi:glucose/arabinose dehydrogenase